MLREPAQAIRVVRAVVGAVSVPVTVKMRAGWSPAALTSVSLARELEQIGVRAFTLHARTAVQGFEGSADWSWIAEMKAALETPVIGNGDIREPGDALRMVQATGCDAVMIGRAAIGNPWILRDTAAVLRGESPPPEPSWEERVEAALWHVRALAESLGERHAVIHLRGQLPHYFRGMAGAARARERMMKAVSVADVEEIMASLEA